MIIFDREKKRFVEFNSSPEFSLRTVKKLSLKKNLRKLRYEKYQNEDYDMLVKDLPDKKFLKLKPCNRKAEPDASSFNFD